jgi:hypothetical protein
LTLRPAAAMAARRRSFLLPIGRAPRVFDALGRSERTELGLGFGGLGGQPARVSQSRRTEEAKGTDGTGAGGSGTVRRRRRARGRVGGRVDAGNFVVRSRSAGIIRAENYG